MATVNRETAPLTAEEFARLPESDLFEELVRGRIVRSPLPNRLHGYVCAEIVHRLARYLEERPIGRGLGGNSGVVTERDPDTVRGPDVAFYSFERLPRDADLDGYGPEIPELVFEVHSPSDRWIKEVAKAAEYVEAGVSIVVLLDPRERKAHVFEADRPPLALGPDEVLRLESVLPGFEAVVGDLFG